MKRKLLYAVMVLALTGPAAAEPLRVAQASPVLPPHEVLTIIRSTGLDPLDRPVRRGPTYSLRATDRVGEEVRVVVDARAGNILSVTPVIPVRGPREPQYRDGFFGPPLYLPPEAPMLSGPPPGVYRSGPPPLYEPEPPMIYAPRPGEPMPPREAVRRPPQSVAGPGVLPPPSDPNDPAGAQEPQVIAAPDLDAPGGSTGLLPPPPERFPQRAPPPPEPKAKAKATPKRAASAAPPLPKPRPVQSVPAAKSSPPPAGAPARKGDGVPH